MIADMDVCTAAEGGNPSLFIIMVPEDLALSTDTANDVLRYPIDTNRIHCGEGD